MGVLLDLGSFSSSSFMGSDVGLSWSSWSHIRERLHQCMSLWVAVTMSKRVKLGTFGTREEEGRERGELQEFHYLI